MTWRLGGRVQEKVQLFSRRLANLDKKLISVFIWQSWQRWQSWQSLTVDAGTWNKSSLSLNCITPLQRCIVLKTHTHICRKHRPNLKHTHAFQGFTFQKTEAICFPVLRLFSFHFPFPVLYARCTRCCCCNFDSCSPHTHTTHLIQPDCFVWFSRARSRVLQSTTTMTAAAAVQIKEEHVFWVPRWWRWRRLLGCLPALAVNWKLIGGVTSLLFFILFRNGIERGKKSALFILEIVRWGPVDWRLPNFLGNWEYFFFFWGSVGMPTLQFPRISK